MQAVRLRATMLAFVLALTILSLGVAQPAQAASSKEKAYKIGTYVLGAGTIYALTKKKGTLALIGAAGTYVAYKGWKREADRRRSGRRFSGRR